MANVLSEERRQQVVALGRLGWSLRRIEDETGVRRETASAYLKAAGVVVRAPRGRRLDRASGKPASEVLTESASSGKPASEVLTDSAAGKPASEVPTDSIALERPVASPRASAAEPYRELIVDAINRGRNAMVIWQDLVDEHGFAGGYSSVRRFVVRLRERVGRDAHPVIVTEPGEEMQVDYGTGPMVLDPASGKYRRTRLFVLTLGYSRKSIRLLTFRSSTRIWCELHEQAFRRLGGAARVCVLDNLGEGVLKPDIYDPQINPLYRDVLRHYGVVALPCRVRNPDRKGKCESGVDYGQEKLHGLRFETIELAQAYLDRWETRWADTRIHGTTKRQVSAMFAVEQPALRPLPIEPFRYYDFGKRSVHIDGCIEVQGAYYAPPPGWIGREVGVQWDDMHVRILDAKTGELLREHLRTRAGGYRIKPEDRSRATPPSTLQLLERACEIGDHVGELARTIHRNDGEAPGVRRIQGLVGLARKHTMSALDRACAFALDQGAPTYRFVRSYLEHVPELPITLLQIDPIIRDLTEYRALVERITEGDEA
jgi:transposase